MAQAMAFSVGTKLTHNSSHQPAQPQWNISAKPHIDQRTDQPVDVQPPCSHMGPVPSDPVLGLFVLVPKSPLRTQLTFLARLPGFVKR